MKNAAKSTATINRRQFLKSALAGVGTATAFLATTDAEACKDMRWFEQNNPILKGKNIEFTDRWLEVIGNDRKNQVTPEQFKAWVAQLDKVFEVYEEFTGIRPRNARGIAIADLLPKATFKANNSGRVACAHAHGVSGLVCFDDNVNGLVGLMMQEICRHQSPTFAMMHELAHLFSNGHSYGNGGGQSPWAEGETAANVLHSYAMEKGGFSYGVAPNKVSGITHRRDRIQWAINNLRDGSIEGFAYECGTAYDLYMLGLPNVVGWDVMKRELLI